VASVRVPLLSSFMRTLVGSQDHVFLGSRQSETLAFASYVSFIRKLLTLFHLSVPLSVSLSVYLSGYVYFNMVIWLELSVSLFICLGVLRFVSLFVASIFVPVWM